MPVLHIIFPSTALVRVLLGLFIHLYYHLSLFLEYVFLKTNIVKQHKLKGFSLACQQD